MASKKTATTVPATEPTKVNEYVGTKDAPAMAVLPIPIASILVIGGFNVRIVDEKRPDGEGARNGAPYAGGAGEKIGVLGPATDIKSLAADIKAHGLLQPVLVRPVGNAFALVSGHRRLAACKSLGLKTIPCVVRNMTDHEAYLFNLAENMQREDLSPGEIAERAILLRKKFPAIYVPGEDGASKKLADDMNVSKSYMLNLIRMAEKLDPRIWNVCRSGRNVNSPPHARLHEWLKLADHDAQWEAYQAWMGVPRSEQEAADGGEGSADGTPAVKTAPPYKRPTNVALEAMEAEIVARQKSKTIKPEEAAIALAVLRYAIGKTDAKGNAPAAPYQAAKSPTPPKAPKA